MENNVKLVNHIGIFLWSIKGGAFANLGKVLSKGFLECDIKRIDLITLESTIEKIDDLPPCIKIIPLGCKKSSLSVIPLFMYLKKVKPDVLISLSWINNIPAVLAHCLFRKNTKLVVTEHSSISYKSKVEHKNELKLRFMPYLMRLLYPQADGLVAVSEGVLHDLERTINLPTKRKVIHNPIDIDKIEICANEIVRHEWFNEQNRNKFKIILGVGRLEKQKRFDILVRSFDLVRKSNSAKLIILGEGRERQKLEKIIDDLGCADDVSLVGFQDNPYAFMSKSDLFVLSSEEEGFGLVLLEAMICNCPIISPDLDGGPRDILGNGKFAYLVERNDINGFACAMNFLLNNDEYCGYLRRNGKSQARKFSSRLKAEEYLSFIASL